VGNVQKEMIECLQCGGLAVNRH